MRIRTAIFGVYVLASAVGLVVLMALVLRDVRLRYVESMRRTLGDTAVYLAAYAAPAAPGEAWAQKLSNLPAGTEGLRVFACDPAGRVLFDAAGRDLGQVYAWNLTGGGPVASQNYTTPNIAEVDNELRVAVKKVSGGAFSTFANDGIRTGDEIDVMVPQGRFGISPDPGAARTYVAIAAGSGSRGKRRGMASDKPIWTPIATGIHRTFASTPQGKVGKLPDRPTLTINLIDQPVQQVMTEARSARLAITAVMLSPPLPPVSLPVRDSTPPDDTSIQSQPRCFNSCANAIVSSRRISLVLTCTSVGGSPRRSPYSGESAGDSRGWSPAYARTIVSP